ncbi:MAG: hypothetical protein ACXWUL_10545, partial [Caldimonas sp.]
MNTIDLERLRAIGLSATLEQRARALAEADSGTALAPMRVTTIHRSGLALSDGRTVRAARALPHLLRPGADALAVGDWVLAACDAAGDLWVREHVEPTS